MATPVASVPGARVPARRRGRAAATLVAKRPLDRSHDPVIRIEEALVHLGPAVEPVALRRDREQPRRVVEAVVLRDALDDRLVALFAECALRRRRPEVLEER